EMVIGDHHDRIRPRRVEMHLHLAKQPRGLVRGVLGDLGGIVGRVRDADCGNEFSHRQLQEQGHAFRGPFSRRIYANARESQKPGRKTSRGPIGYGRPSSTGWPRYPGMAEEAWSYPVACRWTVLSN